MQPSPISSGGTKWTHLNSLQLPKRYGNYGLNCRELPGTDSKIVDTFVISDGAATPHQADNN
jgi:hypothetical protein